MTTWKTAPTSGPSGTRTLACHSKMSAGHSREPQQHRDEDHVDEVNRRLGGREKSTEAEAERGNSGPKSAGFPIGVLESKGSATTWASGFRASSFMSRRN